jgi:hypothetical protein
MSSGPGAKLLFAGATVAVTVTVVAAMVVLGPPSRHRKQRLDDVRVQNLQTLEQLINNFVIQRKQLPDSLAELARDTGFRSSLQDPESGATYGYERLTAQTYRLCATFDLPPAAGYSAVITVSFPDRRYVPPAEEAWGHGAGRQCFDRRAPAELSDKRP